MQDYEEERGTQEASAPLEALVNALDLQEPDGTSGFLWATGFRRSRRLGAWLGKLTRQHPALESHLVIPVLTTSSHHPGQVFLADLKAESLALHFAGREAANAHSLLLLASINWGRGVLCRLHKFLGVRVLRHPR